MDAGRKLRLMTYLVPGQPMGLFHCYQQYLEQALGCHSYLIAENRWSGPGPDREDPFTADDVDIAFMSSTSYIRQLDKDNRFLELLPVAPIFIHPQSGLRPIYFSEVIIRKDRAETCKTLYDMKGYRWAYNDEDSLSGNLAVRRELKRMGFNTSFFSQIVKSGSHLNSIQMVKDGRVDLAAVDSHCLVNWLSEHPEDKKEIHVLCTLGPNPVPPIVINTRLPAKVKSKICEAFLEMNRKPEWRDLLGKYHVWGFKGIDSSLYDSEKDVTDSIKDQALRTVYY